MKTSASEQHVAAVKDARMITARVVHCIGYGRHVRGEAEAFHVGVAIRVAVADIAAREGRKIRT